MKLKTLCKAKDREAAYRIGKILSTVQVIEHKYPKYKNEFNKLDIK